MKSLAGLAGLTLLASLVTASEPIPFDSPRWQIAAEENRIEQYRGRRAWCCAAVSPWSLTPSSRME